MKMIIRDRRFRDKFMERIFFISCVDAVWVELKASKRPRRSQIKSAINPSGIFDP
jgi:hypothetical protein